MIPYANENACVSAAIVSPNRRNGMIVTVYAISGRAMINRWGVTRAVEQMHKQVFATGAVALVSNLKDVSSPPGSVKDRAMPRATCGMHFCGASFVRNMHFAGPVSSSFSFSRSGSNYRSIVLSIALPRSTYRANGDPKRLCTDRTFKCKYTQQHVYDGAADTRHRVCPPQCSAVLTDRQRYRQKCTCLFTDHNCLWILFRGSKISDPKIPICTEMTAPSPRATWCMSKNTRYVWQ